MRKAREALRLMLALQLSHRQTGKLVSLSHNTAARYQRLVQEKGLDWEAVSALSDDALKAILYPLHFQPTGRRVEPDWPTVHKEMQRKGVVIPPFSTAARSRGQATSANFCFGVMPPRAMFGRS